MRFTPALDAHVTQRQYGHCARTLLNCPPIAVSERSVPEAGWAPSNLPTLDTNRRRFCGFEGGRGLRRAILAFAAMSGPSMARDDDLGSFLSAYRCPVTLRLASIHARGDRKREDERFLILALAQGELSYVQCEFYDDDRHMICEAASGYYSAPAGAPRSAYLPADSVAALARLGFSTDDSHGNFQQVMETPHPSDFAAVAEVLLTALYESYGARLASKIEVHSALVEDLGPVLNVSDCPPVS